MKSEQTLPAMTALIMSGMLLLSASGLAGAHGAPEVDEVPEGFVKASITSQPDIQGLRALILDAPRPAILLRYQGDDSVTVLGTEGEKFLRFSRDAVEVNVASPSWKDLPNAPKLPENEATQSDQSDQPTWTTLSQSGSFGWLDPRLNEPHNGDHLNGPRPWSIGIETAEGITDHIRGELIFKPIP
ncbi:hypothetical protein [Marinobacter lipolyticus]|uniref:hypothetical protein n=1 Tax=Marinobacter lipolyticus TaxID=209639 RepID=UPI003A8E92D1